MSELFTLAKQMPAQSNGRPYGGARLYFFRAGTTTDQTVYTTQDLDVAHDQPVEADANGKFPPIFINPIADYDYRYQLKTSADVLIDDVDDYPRTGLVSGTGIRYARTASEISASVTPTVYSPALIPDIERYGASPSASAAANTTAIQAAINANYGGFLRVPRGTYNVATTGSTTAPVGDALSITDEITILFEGIIKGTNNCNVFHINAGSQDVVTFMESGGGVQGYGTFFETTNRNGSLIKCTAGIPRVYKIKLIDPPQYAIISEGCDEGHVSEVEIIGGKDTYPGDNNYGICLVDASTGWKIDRCKTIANATGGKVSQAVASITLGSGTADRTQLLENRFFAQWEKGSYLIADDCQINGNWVYNNSEGEGLRVVGKRAQVNNNKIRSCLSGGITLYDAEGAQCANNHISDCEAIGVQLSYAGSSSGKSLSNARIHDNKIECKTSGSNLIEGIRVQGDSGTATTERRIEIIGNHIINADRGTNDTGAIRFLPNNASTVLQDLRVERNTIEGCGGHGINFAAGVYQYARINDNKIRDPGSNAAGLGSNRNGFNWAASITWTGGSISRNDVRSETAGSGMAYGFRNDTESNIQSAEVANNHVRGHVTAPYSNLRHSSQSLKSNRSGDSALHGTLSTTAAASFVITNSNARSGMRIAIYPTNAAAVALQAGTDALYFDNTYVADTSFTLKTGAGGNAAGTETFEWEIMS